MKKYLIPIIVIVIIVILVVVFYKPAPKQTIKIGAILPLTGTSASFGENTRNGIDLALRELEYKNKQFSIIYEDDQYDAAKTVTAFNKLVNVDGVKYVITLGSNNSNAIGPLAQEKNIVHIAISTSPKVLDYKFSIKNGSDAIELGRAMAQEVIRSDYRRVFILCSNHEGVLPILDVFKKYSGINERIIGEELVNPSETDYRTVLTKAKTGNPDAILLEILPLQGAGLAAKQARELGLDVPLFSAIVFESQNAITASEGALEGQWYVNSDVTDNFREKFKGQYNKIPSREAGNGYDSIALINQAIHDVGDDPIKVNDYLHKMTNFDSKSIRGGIKVENGNFINFAIVKTIKNGQFVPYSE